MYTPSKKKVRKVLSKEARLLLTALRCEFVMFEGRKLSTDGWGYFGPKSWRIIFKIKSFFNPKLKIEMDACVRRAEAAKESEKYLLKYSRLN